MEIIWDAKKNYMVGKTADVDLTNKKVAAFDMDDTLIKTKSGKEFAENDDDWQLFCADIQYKLNKLQEDGYHLVVVSNQNGVSKGKVNIDVLKSKIQKLITHIGLNFTIFCAFADDGYRKPRIKVWNLVNGDKKTSFFCGDAAGLDKRKIGDEMIKKDFADSDLKFAKNVGIKFMHRDEFVYGKKYEESIYKFNYPIKFSELIGKQSFTFHPKHQEMIINVGLPASGKSSFTMKYITPHDYVYVNQDTLKTQKKCLSETDKALKAGKSVVIDNTNVTKEHRKEFIELAIACKVTVRCFVFNTPLNVCMHNSYFRNYITNGVTATIPKIVYNTMNKKFVKPELSEGFSSVESIDFKIDLNNKMTKQYKMYYF